MSMSSTDSPMDNLVIDDDDNFSRTAGDDDQPMHPWKALCSCAGMKYVIIAVGLAMSQQLTGINAIMFYGPLIFEKAGVPSESLLLVTMAAIGTWNLVAVFISVALVDRLGRRPLMLSALAAMFVATLVSGIAYTVDGINTTVESVLLIAMTMIFIGAFESGPGPLFFVMASESFSPLIKSEGLVLCNTLAWLFNICLVFLFPLLNKGIGAGPTQFILAGTCVLSWLIVFFRVPETKAVDEEADKAAAIESDGQQPSDDLRVEMTVKRRVVACLFVGILTGCLYGYQTGIVSGLSGPLMNATVSPYNLTAAQSQSIFTSLFTTEILVGGMIGSFIGTPISDRCGRRPAIIICALFGLVPSITLSLFANYWSAIASRTVQGVAVGMSCVVGPQYINEVAPIKRRGSLGTVFQVCVRMCMYVYVCEVWVVCVCACVHVCMCVGGATRCICVCVRARARACVRACVRATHSTNFPTPCPPCSPTYSTHDDVQLLSLMHI